MGFFTADDPADDWPGLFNRAVDEAVYQALVAAKAYADEKIALAATPEWTAYTPTITGIPAAGSSARYTRAGKMVTVEFLLFVGGAATGTFTFSKPTASVSSAKTYALGAAIAYDASVGDGSRRSVTVVNDSAGAVFFLVDSLASAATVGTGVPWAWATGDYIGGMFSYREA